MFEALISQAIKEDAPSGDITSNTVIPETTFASGKAIAKGDYVVSGIDIAREVYKYVDSSVVFNSDVKDGQQIKKGAILFTVKGKARSILLAERTALNIMGHMMGIATKTKHFVDMVKGTRTTILDTRKTTPGIRSIEKLAVTHGGGQNHRFSLSDAVLLKENHIAAAGGIARSLLMFKELKKKDPNLKIEIEVRDLQELNDALTCEFTPDVVMLDNMLPADTKKAVTLVNNKFKLESSGGITEGTIKDYAATGVDYISLGTITHSVNNADISFLLDSVKGD